MEKTIKGFRGEFEFLSNFYPCKIKIKDCVFNSVEIAFQASKCENKNDRLEFVQLQPFQSGDAKRIGRRVRLRSDWETVKIDIMRHLLRIKFEDSELASKLKATKGIELVEFNDWGDIFWGVCRGKGKNVLGNLLTEIRNELLGCDDK